MIVIYKSLSANVMQFVGNSSLTCITHYYDVSNIANVFSSHLTGQIDGSFASSFPFPIRNVRFAISLHDVLRARARARAVRECALAAL